jgi:hypothetical protein
MDPYLQISSVSKEFAGKRGPYVAVEGVSLEVGRGEIVSRSAIPAAASPPS